MNRNDSSSPPADLLARCLSTIPQTAKIKATAPRLSPDAVSRKRLAWLGVGAAIPAVTVLVVLPVRNHLASKGGTFDGNKSQAAATEPRYVIPYCKSISVNRQASFDGPDANHWYTGKTFASQSEWEVGRGRRVTSGTLIERLPNSLSGDYIWGKGGMLETPDGTVYTRTGDSVETLKRDSPGIFRYALSVDSRNLFEPERATAMISGYGSQVTWGDGKTELMPVVIEKRVQGEYSSTFPGQPRQVEVCVCVQRPSAGYARIGAPVIRVRFYRDRETGLCYAYEAFAIWEKGDRKAQEPLLVGMTRYRYDLPWNANRLDFAEQFDPAKFKQTP
ncbi:MAG: hypothetical protein H7145_17000 [Akkermansiaceae bacterium]|nr:hypothetical protein [Armatimonadota bacterium]